MSRKISLFFVFILLLSCNAKKVSAPENYGKILNLNQMTNVMVDIYLIEASLQNITLDTEKLRQYTNHYYRYLYKKHKINHQQFTNSMEYYCFHTKELSKIYTAVITQLAAMQTSKEDQ